MNRYNDIDSMIDNRDSKGKQQTSSYSRQNRTYSKKRSSSKHQRTYSQAKRDQSYSVSTDPRRVNRQRQEQMSSQSNSEGRVALRKHKRRRSTATLYYFIIALFVITIGVVLCLTVFFRTKQVTVAGSSPYNDQDLIDSTKIKTGDNLFLIKTHDIEAKMEKQFPNIENIKLKRRLPGTIEIDCQESKVVGVAASGDKYLLLSGSGKIVDIVEQKPDDAIFTKVSKDISAEIGDYISEDNTPGFGEFQKITSILQKHNIDKILGINVENDFSISINYDNRIRIDLGSMSDIEEKILWAKELIVSHLSDKDVGVLDVSSSEKPRKANFIPSTPEEMFNSNDSIPQTENEGSDTSSLELETSFISNESNLEDGTN